MKNWLNVCFAILVLIVSDSAFSYDDVFWKEIAKRPDVKITVENDVKRADFSGGVTISENGLEIDNSGKGAVLCLWMIYVEMKSMSKPCFPTEQNETKEKLDYAIDRTNDFIVANSLTPVTKAQLEEKIQKVILSFEEKASKMPKGKLAKECTVTMKMKEHLIPASSERFRKSIDDFLSIPRPPVMNPCL